MLTDVIGYLAGVLLMLSFLPQVIKSIITRNTGDISMMMLLLTLGSGVLYEVYAIRLALKPVIVMNGIFCILVLVQTILKIVTWKKAPDSE